MLDREPGSGLPLAEQFRFDAGSRALNLLSTYGYRRSPRPVERLASPRRLREWLTANSLPALTVDEGGLHRTRELREAAYRLLAEPDRPRRADAVLLGAWSARAVPGPGLQWEGDAVAWQPPALELDDVLTGLARALAAYAVERPDNLRFCEAAHCRMIYLDTSRGHRRRWCSMQRCGNAAKVAAHRANAAS